MSARVCLKVVALFQVLTQSILPVFAILALGFVMGRFNQASEIEARALNRIAFIVMQPCLIFPLMAGLDFSELNGNALLLYGLNEVIVFLASYAIARLVFNREHLEAFLLSMAMIFVNSLLYIWPISFLIYGEPAALPITAIVAWDASIAFGFFIICMELMTKKSANPLGSIVRNPVLIAIVLGTVASLASVSIPTPVLTFMDFAGSAAAPLTLFALGVILSQSSLRPSACVATFAAIKLFIFPVTLTLMMIWFAIPPDWSKLFTLNAAGPSGAMAFALALLYGVRTDAIAQVIIWTSVLSLFSLAFLA